MSQSLYFDLGDCIFGTARVANSCIWITSSLCLWYSECPRWRCIYRQQAVEWRNKRCWTITLCQSTLIKRAYSCSSISEYTDTVVNSSIGSSGVIIIHLCCQYISCQRIAIWLLVDLPVILSNLWSSEILAFNTNIFSPTRKIVLDWFNFSRSCIYKQFISSVRGWTSN